MSNGPVSEHEMPMGFSMRLAMDHGAMSKFGTLSSEQKDKIISYIKESKRILL